MTASDISPAMPAVARERAPIADSAPIEFEPASYWLDTEELREPFVTAGFSDLTVEARARPPSG